MKLAASKHGMSRVQVEKLLADFGRNSADIATGPGLRLPSLSVIDVLLSAYETVLGQDKADHRDGRRLESFTAMGAEVLLLGGSKSQQFLRLALDALSTVLPHVRRVELEGPDHLGPDNRGKPERVAEELGRFFAG